MRGGRSVVEPSVLVGRRQPAVLRADRRQPDDSYRHSNASYFGSIRAPRGRSGRRVLVDGNGHAGVSARNRTTRHAGSDLFRAGGFPGRHLDDGFERRTAMSSDRQHDDDMLDETIEETFPASDAPANTVETGVVAGPPSTETTAQVVDNPARHRFELTLDGHTAFLAYERTNDSLTLLHTEVPAEFRGRHFGELLVNSALAIARGAGLRVVVVCPFARAYLRRHPPSPPIR